MNVLEKYAKKHDLYYISVGIWPKKSGELHANYVAYVHWKDENGVYASGCISGNGQTMEAAILNAIETMVKHKVKALPPDIS